MGAAGRIRPLADFEVLRRFLAAIANDLLESGPVRESLARQTENLVRHKYAGRGMGSMHHT